MQFLKVFKKTKPFWKDSYPTFVPCSPFLVMTSSKIAEPRFSGETLVWAKVFNQKNILKTNF